MKIDRQILKQSFNQIFQYIWIFKNLQTNISIYSVVQKSTNEYPNIVVLGKWHEYKCKYYLRAIIFKYSNIHAHHWKRFPRHHFKDMRKAIFIIKCTVPKKCLAVALDRVEVNIQDLQCFLSAGTGEVCSLVFRISNSMVRLCNSSCHDF